MATANKEYFDAQLRHQIGVRRYTAGEVRRMLELIGKADKELATKLRKRLQAFGDGPIDLQSARWKALAKDIREARQALWKQANQQSLESGIAFSDVEVDFEQRMIQAALPIEVNLAAVNLAQLHASIKNNPFAGGSNAARNLAQWWAGVSLADQQRILEALQMGVIQGESVQSLVRRVIGTKRNQFADGVLATSRRNAEAIVRTFTNFVSNTAREEVWKANNDIIQALRWNSTLDGRTSAVCRGRDGHFAPVPGETLPPGKFTPRLQPPTARPPAHPNCRSIMTAVLDSDGVMDRAGERPFVRSTVPPRRREKEFRKEAISEIGQTNWRKLSPGQRNAEVRKRRLDWGRRNIGTVPPDTNYNDWLADQPAAFQDEVLGKTKGKLFRTGKIKMDQYVDRRGNELTLDELSKTEPEAFIAAGLDPDDF